MILDISLLFGVASSEQYTSASSKPLTDTKLLFHRVNARLCLMHFNQNDAVSMLHFLTKAYLRKACLTCLTLHHSLDDNQYDD